MMDIVGHLNGASGGPERPLRAGKWTAFQLYKNSLLFKGNAPLGESSLALWLLIILNDPQKIYSGIKRPPTTLGASFRK